MQMKLSFCQEVKISASLTDILHLFLFPLQNIHIISLLKVTRGLTLMIV